MEDEVNDVDLMTISHDSLTLVKERKDIDVIDLNQEEITMDENKDMNEADYRPHDEIHFYFNKVAPLLHEVDVFKSKNRYLMNIEISYSLNSTNYTRVLFYYNQTD